MNKRITLLFILISYFSFSQSDPNSYLGGITVEYGQKLFNDDFSGNLKSINSIKSNTLPIETISSFL